MANNYDARPFVDLQKDAEEFQSKFEEDIEKCKSILDTKITALICDPDSLGSSVGPKQNALAEFSKAKYDIYIGMKSTMNDMEREWLKYISEMKKLFIDNVEVFLANTKLEVKLPSSGSLSSSSLRKSPGSKRSTAVTSSIYPIISSITKSIPGFSQTNKSVDLEMEEDVDMDLNLSWSNAGQKSKFNERVGRSNAFLNDNVKSQKSQSPGQSLKRSSVHAYLSNNDISEDEEEESDESEQYVPEPSAQHGRRGRVTAQNKKVNEISTKKVYSSESKEETSESESELTLVNFRKSINRSSSRSKFAAISKESRTNSDESEEIQEVENNNTVVSLKGRKRKQAPKKQTNAEIVEEEEKVSEPESEQELNVASVTSKTSRSRSSAAKNAGNLADVALITSKTSRGRLSAAKNAGNLADVTSFISETRRGRSAARNSTNVSGKTSKVSGRPARRKTLNVTIIEKETPVSPRTVTFNPAIDDDFDAEAPIAQPSKSVARRKTLLPDLAKDVSGCDIIPGYCTPARSKRKTISGVSDLESVAPSKRLKNSNIKGKNAIAESEGAVTDDNLLEINESYSQWIALNSIDGKIPISPGIYEVKVWRAKKSAYIGYCDSLRQKLTLHKLKQNSGHKHLDKFIERNYDDIQIRYEIVSSVNDAKVEVNNRVNSFVALHKTTPAYN